MKRDDVELVCCSKSNLKRNNQVEILDMHFVVYSNFSRVDLASKKKSEDEEEINTFP